MQAELVGSNVHKYRTCIRASSPTKERFSHSAKFSKNPKGSMADGVYMQGSYDRNIGDNGGDMARVLNDMAVQHILVKGLKKAENVRTSSRPDFSKLTPIKLAVNSEICGSDPRVVPTKDTLVFSEEAESNKQSDGNISIDLDQGCIALKNPLSGSMPNFTRS
ncbi:hypothetical protein ACOSP7_026748 [Xanthoceras sorbifolium]